MNYCIVCRDNEKSEELKKILIERILLDYDEVKPDYVISIGGDGTIIRAIHKYPNAIIFGLHNGHLGFYNNYSINELDLLINDINNNLFNIQSYDLLSSNIKYDNNILDETAINEISIVSPVKSLSIDIYVDNILFENYRGTGLCISTSSGSTAFNKSLSGSVIDSNLKTIQITEIAGINSNAYKTLSSSLVLSSERIIELKNLGQQDIYITMDHLSYQMTNLDSIIIKYDNKKIKMGFHSPEDFIKRINRTFLSIND
ncbi:MAG: NAD kinase [Anaeroplasma sp.]